MKMVTKGKNRVDSLVRMAKKERDEQGYRENLGYETILELDDYLKTLCLSYREESEVLEYFYRQCDTL